MSTDHRNGSKTTQRRSRWPQLAGSSGKEEGDEEELIGSAPPAGETARASDSDPDPDPPAGRPTGSRSRRAGREPGAAAGGKGKGEVPVPVPEG